MRVGKRFKRKSLKRIILLTLLLLYVKSIRGKQYIQRLQIFLMPLIYVLSIR